MKVIRTFYIDKEIAKQFKEKCEKEGLIMGRQIEIMMKKFIHSGYFSPHG